jgi:hypothetical protein
MFTDRWEDRLASTARWDMHKFFSVAVAAVTLMLGACGGDSFKGSSSGGSTGGSSTSGGGTNTPVYSIGSGTGSAFQAGMIGISNKNVSAGGTTSLDVTVVDQAGTLYTGAMTTVVFNSPCVAQGLASITAAGTSTAGQTPGSVTTSTGSVSATYTATGCSGDDVVTASAAVAGSNVSATGTVTVQAAAIGSIQFKSATPATIGLKGTGLNETSTVVFKVVDSSGGPRPGVTVNFALNTNTGGITLAPTSAVSGTDGTVQTVVSAGTAHTSVRVTASIDTPALSTQSGVLAVTTGIPSSNAFSLAVSCQNVEGLHLDGVPVTVTARLADRYNNPAPDGTTVAFTASGGHIGGNCTTPSDDQHKGDGTCAVTWTSANPRPTPMSTPPSKRTGRVVVLGTAIGEESFQDSNSNGYYDTGEVFSDLGEPYRDDNESGAYEAGEYFLDFDQNGSRTPPSGSFVGIKCTGSTPSSSCSTSTLAIGQSNLIIMSGGSPTNIVPASGTSIGAISAGASKSYSFLFQDENNNPLPAGTQITASTVGTGLSVNAPSTVVVPCTTDPTNYSFSVSAASTYAGGGSLTLQTTSPGGGGANGIVTILSYPLN